jgi:hypothetical protein
MANLNVFSCEAGTFTIDEAISGQTTLAMYDSLKQAALLPEIRMVKGGGGAQVIMPYEQRTPEALFSQIQAAMGSENRTVSSREFYWLEYDSYDTLTFVTGKAAGGVPAAGVPSTLTIDNLSRSVQGNFTKPVGGYYAYVKENNRQKVLISSVNKTADTLVVTPINGEVLDLTKYSRYTFIIDPLRAYTLGDTNAIQTEGLVFNPPTMYKAFAQKYEKGFAIGQDEIDNYVYDRDFKVIKGLNTRGEAVEYMYIPALNGQMEAYITDNKTLNTLFGQRDYTDSKGMDGIVPTAEKYGMFNAGYDIFSNVSLKQILWGMIKTLRRVEGCNSYMLAHDFNFWMDWSESIGDMIKAANQSYRYELFGGGGTGARDFSYYSFNKFEAFGYEFVPYMIDAFDNRRYGNALEYFALMLPNAKFKDQKGNTVPLITYCHLEGAEPAKIDNIWIDDARKRGERELRMFMQTTYGIEIHAPTKLGILKKTSTQ